MRRATQACEAGRKYINLASEPFKRHVIGRKFPAKLFRSSSHAVICNQRGLHARAAAKFVKLATQYESEIIVEKGDMQVGRHLDHGPHDAGGVAGHAHRHFPRAALMPRPPPARSASLWNAGLTRWSNGKATYKLRRNWSRFIRV